MKRAAFFLTVVAALLAVAALIWRFSEPDDAELTAPARDPGVTASTQVERGAYLARAGNCMACHTRRGGAPFAGGRGIETPFGMVYSSNLTADPDTGIGRWTSADFWRALHHGRSRDGRLLSPAFPYTNTTRITRDDADALYAWLMRQPRVVQANQPHTLRWPFGTQLALAVWRALYFRPGVEAPDPAHTAEWNRGAYLVRGPGHCAACHTARNALGGPSGPELGGGLIPVQNWYAPSLVSASEAGVGDWALPQIVRLLKTGQSPLSQVEGPMVEVVRHGTQHLSDTDLTAMAVYLKALPQTGAPPRTAHPAPAAAVRTKPQQDRGARLYQDHCERCHGTRGEGVPDAYPAVAGNRAVTMPQTANLVQIVLHGGFAPATSGNPRPFGMPPYLLEFDDRDVAAVINHVRTSWGNAATPVTETDVSRIRSSSKSR